MAQGSPTEPSHAWAAWWRQAGEDRRAVEVLGGAGLWAASCFFALQSIEKALKALAREPTTLEDLGETTIGELGAMTVGELGVGGKQPRTHSLVRLLDGLYPGHREALLQFRERFAQLDHAEWYEATRYPEWEDHHGRWHAVPKWVAGFTDVEAAELRLLADNVLLVVGSQLPVVPPVEAGDGGPG